MSFNPNGNQVSPINRQSEGYGTHMHGESFYNVPAADKNSILHISNESIHTEKDSNGQQVRFSSEMLL